jgi:hypothetical protein
MISINVSSRSKYGQQRLIKNGLYRARTGQRKYWRLLMKLEDENGQRTY